MGGISGNALGFMDWVALVTLLVIGAFAVSMFPLLSLLWSVISRGMTRVLAAKPDVLMLQEYTADWHEALQKAIGAQYPHTSVVMRDDSFGTFTLPGLAAGQSATRTWSICRRSGFVGRPADSSSAGSGASRLISAARSRGEPA